MYARAKTGNASAANARAVGALAETLVSASRVKDLAVSGHTPKRIQKSGDAFATRC